MAIANNLQTHAHVQMNGVVAAGGSNSRFFSYQFYFRRTSTTAAFVHSVIETAFQSSVAVPVMAALNARGQQTNNAVRCLNDPQDPFRFAARTVAGGVSGESMTTINSVFVLLRTNTRGRSYLGKKHFFPLSESDTTLSTADLLNPTSQALWATAVAAIAAGFTDGLGNPWIPVVYSRKLSKPALLPVATIVSADVTQVLLNKRIGRMGHREVKSVYA